MEFVEMGIVFVPFSARAAEKRTDKTALFGTDATEKNAEAAL